MEEKTPLCPYCGGHHAPDQPTYVDYEGYRFKPPFKCMCCGKKYFCKFCVDVVNGKHYCDDCIENGLMVVCPKCGKKVKCNESHECA